MIYLIYPLAPSTHNAFHVNAHAFCYKEWGSLKSLHISGIPLLYSNPGYPGKFTIIRLYIKIAIREMKQKMKSYTKTILWNVNIFNRIVNKLPDLCGSNPIYFGLSFRLQKKHKVL